MAAKFDQWRDPAEAISAELDADVIFYLGPILPGQDVDFIEMTRRNAEKSNAFLMLTTGGGNPDAAFRMMRALHRAYAGEITLFVPYYCKSAGTLMAVGADHLVVSDFGELGPLDVQMSKPDELGESSSGLVAHDALEALAEKSEELYDRHFLGLRNKSGGQITTKSASEIATALTIGLLDDIYRQIDPMRLGEMNRALDIARAYGTRLNRNLAHGGLDSLINGYPSHGFVIDREECGSLFRKVRAPSADEEVLGIALRDFGIEAMRAKSPVTTYLNENFFGVVESHQSFEDSDHGNEGTEPHPEGSGGSNQSGEAATATSGSDPGRARATSGNGQETGAAN